MACHSYPSEAKGKDGVLHSLWRRRTKDRCKIKSVIMFYTYILRSSTIRISVTSGVRLIYANASPYTMRAVFHIRRNSDRGKWKPISPLRRKSWLVPSKSISNPAAVTFSPSATSEKAKVVNEAVLVHRSLGEGGRLRFMLLGA